MSVRTLKETKTMDVSCPGCNKQKRVEPGLYVCSECGTWFEVTED